VVFFPSSEALSNGYDADPPRIAVKTEVVD
jgi:hypothetical protein